MSRSSKRLAGGKRHILVDTNGLVLAARVHGGADLPDREGGRRLLGEGQELPRLEPLWADGAYTRAGSASGCGTSFGVASGGAAPLATGSCGATG